MTTQYTTILKLALPVQGELSGTWGDVVNDNITQMVEQAIAGKATINSWTANSHTLTTADGTTSESRCAILELTDTGTALTGAGTVTCPTNTKLYIVDNNTAQIITVKTSGGTGVAVPVGKTMLVYCDGTNVVEGVTHANSLSLGTSTSTVNAIDTATDLGAGSSSNSNLPTQLAVKTYVDSQVGTVDTLAEILANGNTTGGTDIAVSTGDDITFADNSKAIFGASSDLQIYHDASDSIINDNGTGSLKLQQGGSTKLEVTATGVDITGTLVSDGLTVESSSDPTSITLRHTGNTSGLVIKNFSGAESQLVNVDNGPMVFKTNDTEAMRIDASGNVGIGTTSPVNGLSLFQYGTQFTGHTVNTYPQPAGNIFFQINTVANTENWFGMTGTYGATTGSANLLLQANLNNVSQQAGHFIASQVISATASDLVFGKMLGGATTGANSSKSEQMRIDSSGNVGIGTSSPDTLLELSKAAGTGTSLVKLANTSSAALSNISQIDFELNNSFSGTNVDVQIGAIKTNAGNEESAFYINTTSGTGTPTERMRIDASGNVGIGSPTTYGLLNSTRSITGGTSNTTEHLSLVNTATGAIGNQATLGFHVAASSWGVAFTGASVSAESESASTGATSLVFGTNPSGASATTTERMRITSSGNVGIGVVPSASSTTTNIELPYGATLSSRSNTTAPQFAMMSNAVGNWYEPTYKIDGFATQYAQQGNDGTHVWSTAASGIAGDDISFSEAMRIDASGNVGIGASSALTSTYLSKAFVYTAGGANFAIGGSSNTNNAILGRFTFYNIANSNSANESSANFYGVTSIESVVVTTDSNAGADSGGYLRFMTKPEAGALTERMIIDSSGDVGIGNSTVASTRLAVTGSVVGANIETTSATAGHEGLIVNRQNSDGIAIAINQAGTTVGSIACRSSGGNLQIHTNESGIDFGGDGYLPMRGSTITDNTLDIGSSSFRYKELYLSGGVRNVNGDGFNAATDNSETAILPADTSGPLNGQGSIGLPSFRWKDLYLSGGAYLGGTAAANKLDDYEEGTWTPAQGSGLTVNGTYSSSGTYTKVGRMVYVKGALTGSTDVACSQNGQICTGLPFPPNIGGENVGISMDDGRTASQACSALSNSAVQNTSAISSTPYGISFAITYQSN